MNKVSYDERLKEYTNAFITYGQKNQMIVAIEELSECQKEICKFMRGKGDACHLAEEIADATICLEQIMYFMGLNDEVSQWMDSKIKRLDKRLQDLNQK